MRFSYYDLAVMEFASNDPTRIHVCGLRFEPGHLVATDGHTMGIVELGDGPPDEADCGSFTVETANLIGIMAALKADKKATMGVVEGPATLGGKATFELDTTKAQFSVETLQGDYPEWRNVVPALDPRSGVAEGGAAIGTYAPGPNGGPIGIQCRYMARVAKAAQRFSARAASKGCYIRQTLTGGPPDTNTAERVDCSPMVFEVDRIDGPNDGKLTMVVMPARI